MKLAPNAHNLLKLVNQTGSLALSLQQTKTILLSLQKQDQTNAELYQLLSRQNQLLHRRLLFLRQNWTQQPITNWLQLELSALVSLAQVHCQLVGWLAQGDTASAGPQLGLPQQPPSPPAQPVPQDSKGPVPALGFD
jgi:hypothetical protein